MSKDPAASEFKKAAALAALPACIEQSFSVSPNKIESIGQVIERAVIWAEWTAEQLEEKLEGKK